MKDIAQLAVDFDTRDVKLNINQSHSDLTDAPVDAEESRDLKNASQGDGVFKPDAETQKYLDHDNILYEGGPKFVEEQLTRELSDTDLALIQTHTYFLMRNLPKDEHREEVLRPFVQVITKPENKKNWLLDTNGLLLRTKNDFERSKTKE